MNQKGFAPIIIVLAVLVLAGIAGGAYFLGKSTNTPQSQSAIQPVPTVTTQPSQGVDETANWLTYENHEFGYTVKYPPDRKVYENPECVRGSLIPQCISISSIPYPLPPDVSYQQYEVRISGIIFRRNAKNIALEDYIKEYIVLLPENKDIKFNEMELGTLKGLYYNAIIMDGARSREFVISKAPYVIEFSGIDDEEGRKILTTFKFTN